MKNKETRGCGYWLYEEDDLYKCSECGEEIWILKGNATHVNYCPNCGEKMSVPEHLISQDD